MLYVVGRGRAARQPGLDPPVSTTKRLALTRVYLVCNETAVGRGRPDFGEVKKLEQCQQYTAGDSIVIVSKDDQFQ